MGGNYPLKLKVNENNKKKMTHVYYYFYNPTTSQFMTGYSGQIGMTFTTDLQAW